MKDAAKKVVWGFVALCSGFAMMASVGWAAVHVGVYSQWYDPLGWILLQYAFLGMVSSLMVVGFGGIGVWTMYLVGTTIQEYIAKSQPKD